MKNRGKHSCKTRISKITNILILIFLVIILSLFLYKFNNTKKEEQILSNIVIDQAQITEQKTERILQLEELKKENSDIIGWLEIANTNINFPVVQGLDNNYYLTHSYKKEYSKDGAIFLDKEYNWNLPSSNLLLYGHNNKNGNMFQTLLEYKSENYFREHPIIQFTTLEEDSEYEIIAVFLSRVYYKNETNVFRYYYFINAENEEEYNYYVAESKKASLYDTGKTAEYGEQLLTLSTCEYSQEDGRFVIVAKKVKR